VESFVAHLSKNAPFWPPGGVGFYTPNFGDAHFGFRAAPEISPLWPEAPNPFIVSTNKHLNLKV